MKDHIVRELVNRLRKIAVENHAHGCLRDLILKEVLEALNEDVEWHKAYKAVAAPQEISSMDFTPPYPRKGQIGNE